MYVSSLTILPFIKRITRVLIRLRECTDWSESSSFAYNNVGFSCDKTQLIHVLVPITVRNYGLPLLIYDKNMFVLLSYINTAIWCRSGYTHNKLTTYETRTVLCRNVLTRTVAAAYTLGYWLIS